MTNIFQSLREWFSPIHHLPAGMYHYISPPTDSRNYRLHLRIEPDGNGILIINASTILHLNETATEHAYYIVMNTPPDKAARNFARRYHVSKGQAKADYQNLIDRIQLLINTPDLDPETFLGFERKEAHTGAIYAPYRLDCALTYRLPDRSDSDLAPNDRVEKELSTEEWFRVLDRASIFGIPHVVFTGGEPTLRQDLPEIIEHAEKNDQVTGLITDGLRFNAANYLNTILLKGLDHIMMVFDPDREEAWSAMQNLVSVDIFLAVHLTLTPENIARVDELLSRFVEIGVRAVSLSVNSQDMKDQLEQTRNLVAAKNLELVWNLPVPYSTFHPVSLETNHWDELPGAGHDWLYLEPDGDVVATQGSTQVLGNFLRDPWEKIWKK